MNESDSIHWYEIYDLSAISDKSTFSAIEAALEKIGANQVGQSLFKLYAQKMKLNESSDKITIVHSDTITAAQPDQDKIHLDINSPNQYLSGTNENDLRSVAFSLERNIVHETSHLLFTSTDLKLSRFEKDVFSSILVKEIPNSLRKVKGVSSDLDARLEYVNDTMFKAGTSLYVIPTFLRGGVETSLIKEMTLHQVTEAKESLTSLLYYVPSGELKEELQQQLERLEMEDFDLLVENLHTAFLMNEDFATDLGNRFDHSTNSHQPPRQHYQAISSRFNPLDSMDLFEVTRLNQLHEATLDSFENDLEQIKSVLKGLDIAIPKLSAPRVFFESNSTYLDSVFNSEEQFIGISNLKLNGISANEKEFIKGIADLLLDLNQSEITVIETKDSKASYHLKWKDNKGQENEVAIN